MPIIIPCFTCFGDQDPVRDALAGTLQSKVGELVSVLWDWTLGWPTNLILLSQNAELLDKEMEELKEMRNDMKRRVECEEAQPSMERMDQVEGWMARVGELDVQVSGFRAARERQSIWITGFCLGRTATEQLKRVRQLTSQLGNLNTVVATAAPDADVLGEEMKELRILRDDLMRSVRIKEADPQMKRTHLVKEWVEMVDALDAEVVEFLGSQSPGYTEVAKKLRQVRKLKSQGNFDGKEVVTQVPPDAVEAVPSKPVSSIVGGEETLSEIRGHLRNEQVGIIGVYGMGGVGKTTILKQINNELCAAGTHGGMFDVVIMITVSRVQNKLAMQKDICERIGLTLAEDDGGAGNSSRLVEHQARTLFKALSRKRFLLLLDDVWEQLDLDDIGVPAPGSGDNMCVVFTTRSEEVCIDMGAHEKVKVDLLSEGQSWELFRRTVRANAILDNPSIRPLAVKVVAQCGGLPLALVTVGRAMANKKLPQEWSAAVKALQDNAQELRGMKDRVLESLKFSFDWLQTDTLRCCLLYCSLFPEDFEIDREQLVEYWIGEGFIDGTESTSDIDMDRARGRGHMLITDLQAACLLESGISDETNKVKLHDTVRDMALWLTSGSVQGYTNKFLVHAGRGPEAPLPGTARWGDAMRISFMCNTNLILPSSIPDCPNAETLLMNGNRDTAGVCDALFTSLPMLRVLDLSEAGIYRLPASIGLLVHLQYLNISLTKIVSLPRELGKLVNLRQLVMRSTTYLDRIPSEAFLPLSRLQSLNMYCSDYSWNWELSESDAGQQRGACLRDLERLDGLSELGLNITTSDCFNGLLSSRRLTRSMRFLSLSTGVDGLTPSRLQAALSSMEKLQVLRLSNCKQIEELRFTADQLQSLGTLVLWFLPLSRVVVDGEAPLRCLRRLEITGCHSLRHITWAGRLPCIESIDVSCCDSMEELLAGDEVDVVEGRVFPMLRMMTLLLLPMLKSIAPRPLPSLESLRVCKCPELKKLPFGANSAERIKLIGGEQEWWDGLQWEDQNVKEQLLPHFVDQ